MVTAVFWELLVDPWLGALLWRTGALVVHCWWLIPLVVPDSAVAMVVEGANCVAIGVMPFWPGGVVDVVG